MKLAYTWASGFGFGVTLACLVALLAGKANPNVSGPTMLIPVVLWVLVTLAAVVLPRSTNGVQ